jgi:hypothetical protein
MRGDYFGVIEHESIAARQKLWQVADMVMLNLLPMAVNDHQAGVGPMPKRLLGDQPPRHLVIKQGRFFDHSRLHPNRRTVTPTMLARQGELGRSRWQKAGIQGSQFKSRMDLIICTLSSRIILKIVD